MQKGTLVILGGHVEASAALQHSWDSSGGPDSFSLIITMQHAKGYCPTSIINGAVLNLLMALLQAIFERIRRATGHQVSSIII
jgi:hypothetical protein